MRLTVTIEVIVTNKRLFRRAAKDIAIASGATFKDLPAFNDLEPCALLLFGTDTDPPGCRIDTLHVRKNP